MILPESHYHLDNLPEIDKHFIDEAHNAVYQWPQRKYEPRQPVITESRTGDFLFRGMAIPTDDCTQNGQPVVGERHDSVSQTVFCKSNFFETKFCQDLQKNLGKIGTRYLYNPPWSLYDWHQDLGGHECAINFLLADTPGAITLHRFPTDCLLNYKVSEMKYKLYRPVLMKSKVDHCIVNLTDRHRYVLTVVLLETKYDVAKKYLMNYNLTGGYL